MISTFVFFFVGFGGAYAASDRPYFRSPMTFEGVPVQTIRLQCLPPLPLNHFSSYLEESRLEQAVDWNRVMRSPPPHNMKLEFEKVLVHPDAPLARLIFSHHDKFVDIDMEPLVFGEDYLAYFRGVDPRHSTSEITEVLGRLQQRYQVFHLESHAILHARTDTFVLFFQFGTLAFAREREAILIERDLEYITVCLDGYERLLDIRAVGGALLRFLGDPEVIHFFRCDTLLKPR